MSSNVQSLCQSTDSKVLNCFSVSMEAWETYLVLREIQRQHFALRPQVFQQAYADLIQRLVLRSLIVEHPQGWRLTQAGTHWLENFEAQQI